MGRKCFVSNCKSGYTSNPEKVNIFSAPRDENSLNLWREAIPRKDRVFSLKDAVCAKHFRDEDIRKEWESGGNCIPLKVARLKRGAIPCIFQGKTTDVSKSKRQCINKKPSPMKVLAESMLDEPFECVPIEFEVAPDIYEEIVLDKAVLQETVPNQIVSNAIALAKVSTVPDNSVSSEYIPDKCVLIEDKRVLIEDRVPKYINNECVPDIKVSEKLDVIYDVIVSDKIEYNKSVAAMVEQNAVVSTPNKIAGLVPGTIVPINENVLSTNGVPEKKSTIVSHTKLPVKILIKTPKNTLINQEILNEIVPNTILGSSQLVPIKVVPIKEHQVFESIFNSDIKTPANWIHNKIDINAEQFVTFTKYIKSKDGIPVANKQIVVDSNLKLKVVVLQSICKNRDIFPGFVKSVEDIENILVLFDKLYLCQGGPNSELYDIPEWENYYMDEYSQVWRNTQCTILSESIGSCYFCNNSTITLNKKDNSTISNSNLLTLKTQQKFNKSVVKLRRIRANQRKQLKRLIKKVNLLKIKLKDLRLKIDLKTENTIIETKIQEMGVSKVQQLFIMQCLEHSKHTTKKTVKYNQDWIRICLLLHSKYPKSYMFLRKNDIMPLPCMRSIRRYLSLSKTNNDFVIDETALSVLGITL